MATRTKSFLDFVSIQPRIYFHTMGLVRRGVEEIVGFNKLIYSC